MKLDGFLHFSIMSQSIFETFSFFIFNALLERIENISHEISSISLFVILFTPKNSTTHFLIFPITSTDSSLTSYFEKIYLNTLFKRDIFLFSSNLFKADSTFSFLSLPSIFNGESLISEIGFIAFSISMLTAINLK